MPNTTTSQFMGMPVPVPTQDPGPQYAVDLNTCLTTIDQHTHAPGFGTLVPTNGINVNLDFPFNNFNATTIRSARFQVQNSPISAGSDIGCVYVSGSDLYYNDTNGNQVRITASGAVAGTPGSIGNLISPATVTYNSGNSTYVFQATTATAANIDAASYLIRDTTSNSKAITLSAPAALAANYSLVLPGALPGSSQLLQSDVAGNLSFTPQLTVDNSTIQIVSNTLSVPTGGIDYAQRAGLNTVIGSTGFNNVSVSAFTLLTSTSITTHGKSVLVSVQPTQTGSARFNINNQGGTGTGGTSNLKIQRDGTDLSLYQFSIQMLGSAGTWNIYIPASIIYLDKTVSAGAHTYSLYANVTSSQTALNFDEIAIVASELG